MLLPQPDSPKSPSDSPSFSVKETPSTALPVPDRVKKYVLRSLTSSRGAGVARELVSIGILGDAGILTQKRP